MEPRQIRHWRRGLLGALALFATPVLGQPTTLSNNPFTGQPGYGSANIIGPQDPDKSWLQPGTTNTLFSSNDYLNHDGMLGVVNSAGTLQTHGHAFFDPLGSNGRATSLPRR
jgi:hypothetical protein